LPGYREKGAMFEVTYPGQAVKIEGENGIKFATISTGIQFRKLRKEDVVGKKSFVEALLIPTAYTRQMRYTDSPRANAVCPY
jgi:hypothetical protein